MATVYYASASLNGVEADLADSTLNTVFNNWHLSTGYNWDDLFVDDYYKIVDVDDDPAVTTSADGDHHTDDQALARYQHCNSAGAAATNANIDLVAARLGSAAADNIASIDDDITSMIDFYFSNSEGAIADRTLASGSLHNDITTQIGTNTVRGAYVASNSNSLLWSELTSGVNASFNVPALIDDLGSAGMLADHATPGNAVRLTQNCAKPDGSPNDLELHVVYSVQISIASEEDGEEGGDATVADENGEGAYTPPLPNFANKAFDEATNDAGTTSTSGTDGLMKLRVVFN